MMFVLICVARTIWPDAAVLSSEIEAQAVILAIAVFAFLLYRLRVRPRTPAA